MAIQLLIVLFVVAVIFVLAAAVSTVSAAVMTDVFVATERAVSGVSGGEPRCGGVGGPRKSNPAFHFAPCGSLQTAMRRNAGSSGIIGYTRFLCFIALIGPLTLRVMRHAERDLHR